MDEVRYRVVTYNTHKRCECGGEIIATGLVFAVMPPLYEHKCNKCDAKIHLSVQFPHLELHLEYIEEE